MGEKGKTKAIKLSYLLIIVIFSILILASAITSAQDSEITNYIIKPDGSIEPDNGSITHSGNNYFLTTNITGTVTIQRDDAVFDGAGYTVIGNAVKGAYNLDDGVLYMDAGFNLTRAWNVTVQNVRIENQVNGITLVNAYYCRILNCTITQSAVDGMKIVWSSNNMIFWNNIISNVDDAIQLFNADNNNIMLNILDPAEYYRVNGNGIQLNGNCSSNKIKGNSISTFDTGIYFGISGGNLSTNLVSYNNFTNNIWNGTTVGGNANSVTSNNFFNNGLICEGNNSCSGNYWSIIPSVYDKSPLTSPVNTNIAPEYIQIPSTQHKEELWAKTTFMGPMIAPIYPTHSPKPTATPNKTTTPSIAPTSEPTTEPPVNSNDLSTPLIIAVIIAFVAVVSIIVLRTKFRNTRTNN